MEPMLTPEIYPSGHSSERPLLVSCSLSATRSRTQPAIPSILMPQAPRPSMDTRKTASYAPSRTVACNPEIPTSTPVLEAVPLPGTWLFGGPCPLPTHALGKRSARMQF